MATCKQPVKRGLDLHGAVRLYSPSCREGGRSRKAAYSAANPYPVNSRISEVEPRGFEPLTSAVQRRHHTFLKVSRVCKIPGNSSIFPKSLFCSFQILYSGCCTAAAHQLRPKSE